MLCCTEDCAKCEYRHVLIPKRTDQYPGNPQLMDKDFAEINEMIAMVVMSVTDLAVSALPSMDVEDGMAEKFDEIAVATFELVEMTQSIGAYVEQVNNKVGSSNFSVNELAGKDFLKLCVCASKNNPLPADK